MILESILIIGIALVLDLSFGDPKNKYHPTAWIGEFIAKLTPFAKNQNSSIEKLGGVLILTTVSGIVILLLLMLNFGFSLVSADPILFILSIILSGLLLKTTIAIRGMEKHAQTVLKSIEQDDLNMARVNLSMIVKRNTKNLDKNHLISGVLESISENTVDGITGPIFYYSLFGLPGAFVYRVINTADSMIGYKTDLFKNVGWFAANCDNIVNYLPSRLTGLMMVFSAVLLQKNWKNSYRVMMNDGKKTESPNAGYPMAALAGALETKFEKINHYELGDGDAVLTKQHILSALSIMKVSSILFFVMISVPIMIVLSLFGWWIHV